VSEEEKLVDAAVIAAAVMWNAGIDEKEIAARVLSLIPPEAQEKAISVEPPARLLEEVGRKLSILTAGELGPQSIVARAIAAVASYAASEAWEGLRRASRAGRGLAVGA